MKTVIRADWVWTGLEDGAIRDGMVVVDGDKIAAVSAYDAAKMPEGATVIERAGEFLMPGLIDAHTHITINPGMGNQIGQLHDPIALQTVGIAAHDDDFLAAFLAHAEKLLVPGLAVEDERGPDHTVFEGQIRLGKPDAAEIEAGRRYPFGESEIESLLLHRGDERVHVEIGSVTVSLGVSTWPGVPSRPWTMYV